ncbi:hypothetical protein ABBQ32_003216 [Trebouxia sp. C0010 RCD-2024]
MAAAERQAFLTTLIWHLESAKEEKLADTLRTWYLHAKKKKAEYVQEMENLVPDGGYARNVEGILQAYACDVNTSLVHVSCLA